MVRYRLHARVKSRREHAFHTARALLFPVILVLLYGGSSSGWPLLLGGFSSFESVLHGVRIRFAEWVVEMLLPGAVFIAGLHLYLWLRPTSLIEEGALP